MDFLPISCMLPDINLAPNLAKKSFSLGEDLRTVKAMISYLSTKSVALSTTT